MIKNSIVCSWVFLFFCVPLLSVSDDASFGRFFTTPDERKRLDKLRNVKPLEVSSSEKIVKPALKTANNKKKTFNASVQLSGVIVRNDGKKQVWVNGKKLLATQGLNAEIKKNSTVVLKKRHQKTGAQLKVGQKWLPHSNKVYDIYSKENE